MECFGPIWTGVAPPPADSVKANFGPVMLGRERPEMAPFFRTGLLFQGYLFCHCEVPRVMVKLRRTARTRMEYHCWRSALSAGWTGLSAAKAESGLRDCAASRAEKMLRMRSHFRGKGSLVLRRERHKTIEVLQHHRTSSAAAPIRPPVVSIQARCKIAVRWLGYFPERGFQN